MNCGPTFGVARFCHFLYCNNPFYVISAALVLSGLRKAFATQAPAGGDDLLLTLLCGYTLLLALAAWLVIRLGKVWEDARTLLMVIVLMFFAIAISFDQAILSDFQQGAYLLAAGLVFSAIVTEALLWSLGIKLHLAYRLPYHAILALLFGYPIWLAGRIHDLDLLTASWGVFAFPWLAALLFLALLPAARRAHRWTTGNGTPWTWPLYPWSLFFMLFVGVCVRSWCLAVSFEASQGVASGFQPYFFTPLVLAAAVLVWEMGRAAGSVVACRTALLFPMLLWLAAFPGAGDTGVQARYVEMLCGVIGGPAFLICLSLLAFYLWTWLRGERLAEAGAMLCLAALAVVGPQTVDWQTFTRPHWAALSAVAAIQVVQSVRFNQSWRLLCIGAAALAAGQFMPGQPRWLSDEIAQCRWHLGALTLLLTGFAFRDELARFIREGAAFLVPATSAAFLLTHEPLFAQVTPEAMLTLLAATIAVALIYWRLERRVENLFAVMACLAALAAGALRQSYLALQGSLVAEGLPWIAWGLTLLAAGMLVSAIKAGAWERFWPALEKWNQRWAPSEIDHANSHASR